jgi:hypothetical protein
VDIGPSFVEAEFMAEDLYLMLDLGENREVVGVDTYVSTILECREKVERLMEPVENALRWLSLGGPHARRTVGSTTGRLPLTCRERGEFAEE